MSALTQSEIRLLLKKARRIYFPGLDLLVAPTSFGHGRILVITPRKVGNAPQRNKVRRRLKAIFYEEKLYERGIDCIVIIKPGGAILSFDELKKALLTIAKPT